MPFEEKVKNLTYKPFKGIDLNNEFFDSLKEDYEEFPVWFQKKANAGERAYIFVQNGIQGFLYVKEENGPITDIDPPLPDGRHIKVGTMKLKAHGTRLGQRFVKKIFDHALAINADDAYVTCFAKHALLLKILKTYGFKEYATKVTKNGEEIVLVKDFGVVVGDVLMDYPKVDLKDKALNLLAIYPEFHTKFLPDSKLNNESIDIVRDVSHANSIHKIYISGIAATNKLKPGDVLLLYRTTDKPGLAKYRSVATSVGVVEETKRIRDFKSKTEFLKYVKPYSVFTEEELTERFENKKHHVAIKFTYNIALPKRVIRDLLLTEVGLPGSPRRWDFLKVIPSQFRKIMELGQINESYIID